MSELLRPLAESKHRVFMIYARAALFRLLDISLKETAICSRGHSREERVLFMARRCQRLIEIVYDRVVRVYI
jgi:hypothetical protein